MSNPSDCTWRPELSGVSHAHQPRTRFMQPKMRQALHQPTPLTRVGAGAGFRSVEWMDDRSPRKAADDSALTSATGGEGGTYVPKVHAGRIFGIHFLLRMRRSKTLLQSDQRATTTGH